MFVADPKPGHLERGRGRRTRAGSPGRQRLVEHGLESGLGRERGGHTLEEEPEHAHREGEHGEQGRDLDETTHGGRSLIDPPGTDHDHCRDAEIRQGIEHRLEDGPQPPDLDPVASEFGGFTGEALALGPLAPEQLHHEGTVERLMGDGRDPADALLLENRRLLDPERVDPIEQDQQREHGERDEGQERIDQQHRDRGEHAHHHHGERERHGMQHIDRDLGVGIDMRDEVARRPAAMERHRQVHVGPGELLAIVPRRPLAGHAGEVPPSDHPRDPQDGDDEQQPGPPDHGGTREGFVTVEHRQDDPVDDATQHDRGRDGACRIDGGAEHADGEGHRMRAHQPDHEPDRGNETGTRHGREPTGRRVARRRNFDRRRRPRPSPRRGPHHHRPPCPPSPWLAPLRSEPW